MPVLKYSTIFLVLAMLALVFMGVLADNTYPFDLLPIRTNHTQGFCLLPRDSFVSIIACFRIQRARVR